jgi:hypothetical protein
LLSKKHLELPKNEIQAMTTDENDFDLQSPIKCCTNARVDAMACKDSRDKSARFDFRRKNSGEIMRMRDTEPLNFVGLGPVLIAVHQEYDVAMLCFGLSPASG